MPSPSVTLLRTQSDERLVALAREGHERAFDAIVERYRRPLLRHSRRVLPESRAEDALQQALISAWTALQRGDEVQNLRPWLYRIVHNTALNALRVNGYDYDELRETLEGTGGPAELAERRALVRQTFAGLAQLPERQREALLAIAVEGRTQDEVAADLGLAPGAVRQLVHRARTTLRAAATAVTPMPVVHWIAAAERGSEPLTTRVAELVAGGTTAGVGATLAKAGAVVVIAGGAVSAPAVVHDIRDHRAQASVAAAAAATPASARSDDGTADQGSGDRTPIAVSTASSGTRKQSSGPRKASPAAESGRKRLRGRGRRRGGDDAAKVVGVSVSSGASGSSSGGASDDISDDSSHGGSDHAGGSGRHSGDDRGSDSSGRRSGRDDSSSGSGRHSGDDDSRSGSGGDDSGSHSGRRSGDDSGSGRRSGGDDSGSTRHSGGADDSSGGDGSSGGGDDHPSGGDDPSVSGSDDDHSSGGGSSGGGGDDSSGHGGSSGGGGDDSSGGGSKSDDTPKVEDSDGGDRNASDPSVAPIATATPTPQADDDHASREAAAVSGGSGIGDPDASSDDSSGSGHGG
jgi:RNA polymerase sigma factor (sigma-70 family)